MALFCWLLSPWEAVAGEDICPFSSLLAAVARVGGAGWQCSRPCTSEGVASGERLMGYALLNCMKNQWIVLVLILLPLFFELQISDEGEVEKMVREVLDANAKQVELYRGGKTKLQGFFTGQVKQHL